MHLSQHADYALRVVLDLATRPSSKIEEIAHREEAPPAFLAKVVRDLVRAGLVKSLRGRKGGVTLGRSPSRINVLQVIEAVDGPLTLAHCIAGGRGCPLSPNCPARPLWTKLQKIVVEELKAATIEDLVKADGRWGKAKNRSGRVKRPVFGTPTVLSGHRCRRVANPR